MIILLGKTKAKIIDKQLSNNITLFGNSSYNDGIEADLIFDEY